jgi:uncharacterized cofD-like protein
VGAGRSAVAIGGGTGQPVVIRALLGMGFATSAVVTMADDGGSSGILREQLGILPPGDARNCLAAMASDPEAGALLGYRFPQGEGLAGHALGNLIIAALADITGSFIAGIEELERIIGARGRVLPSTLESVTLHATDRAGNPVSGQARIAVNPRAVARVALEPEGTPAYAPALDAIRGADVVVMGPGSLYTSLIPNFLVDGMIEALAQSSATRIYVCNVANMRGETCDLDAADHVAALVDHGLSGCIDLVLVHEAAGVATPGGVCDDASNGVEPVAAGPDVIERIRGMVPEVVLASLADPVNPVRHDEARLAAALTEVVRKCPSPPR